mgnify:CR=1 FL=1
MSNSNLFHATKQAVFLDRDGTINVEKDYLYRPEDFEFIPGAAVAIRRLNQAGFLVVVVTNQSGVARGYYTEQEVHHLHRHIDQLLSQADARIDAWYHCPHHPSGLPPYNQHCSCRKPQVGMLEQAAADLEIDLSRSWMVGDKLVDVEAGIAVGCRPVLVLTGYGVGDSSLIPDTVPRCRDLAAAAELIAAV